MVRTHGTGTGATVGTAAAAVPGVGGSSAAAGACSTTMPLSTTFTVEPASVTDQLLIKVAAGRS